MKTIQIASEMSQAGPLISFKNNDGQDVAPKYVLYSISDSNGRPVSGSKLPAFSVRFSEYSIPWVSPQKPGVYKIDWFYGTEAGEEYTASYLYSYDPKFGIAANSELKIYPRCYSTSGYDFYIKFMNQAGVLQDVYEIKWYIASMKGCLQNQREVPNHLGVGEYNVLTSLCYSGSDYYLVWEYKETQDSPLARQTMSFKLV
jgi:hypothetical protein